MLYVMRAGIASLSTVHLLQVLAAAAAEQPLFSVILSQSIYVCLSADIHRCCNALSNCLMPGACLNSVMRVGIASSCTAHLVKCVGHG